MSKDKPRNMDEPLTYKGAIKQFGEETAFDYLLMIEKMVNLTGKQDLLSYDKRWDIAMAELDKTDFGKPRSSER
jgi:hypothetical protein